MGTLAVTYNGITNNFTMSSAPVIAYGGKTILSAGSWSGTKTLNCAGKWMTTDVTFGARTLSTKYTLAKSDIQLTYTKLTQTIVQTFTVGGKKTIPAGGYSRAQFFLVGAGGYGGDYTRTVTNETESDGTNYYQTIAGGGGGGYTLTTPVIDISSTSSYTVTIGNSVTPTAANTRPWGNPSTVTINGTTYTAKGGQTAESTYGSQTWELVGWRVADGAAGNGGAGGSGGGSVGFYYAGDGGTNGGDGEMGLRNDGREKYYKEYMKAASGQGTSTYCDWTGTGIYYAGGGGGAQYYRIYSYPYNINAGGNGGKGGGGNGYAHYRPTGGSATNREPTAGTNGTGGGGGGDMNFAQNSGGEYIISGCAGGSGIVIAKFWEA